MEDLSSQSTSTSINSTEWNTRERELQSVITNGSWQSTDSGNESQIPAAIYNIAVSAQFYTATGTNTIALAVIGTRAAPTEYMDGMLVRFRPANLNTGVVTININSMGAQDLVRDDGTVVQANDLDPTADIECRYDLANAQFLLSRPFISTIRGSLSAGYRTGMTLETTDYTSGSGSTGPQKLTIKAGKCRSSDDTTDIEFAADITGIDFATATSTGSGNFSGTRLAGAWYRLFVMQGKTTGTQYAIYDDSETAANAISDITALTGETSFAYRQIGWVFSQGGSSTIMHDFANPESDPSYFKWRGGDQLSTSLSGNISIGSNSFTRTVVAPPNSVAVMSWRLFNGSENNVATVWLRFSNADANDTVASSDNADAQVYSSNGYRNANANIEIDVNDSRQVIASIYASDTINNGNNGFCFSYIGFRWSD